MATLDGKSASRWAKEATPDNVWQEYPRPQFERSTWKNSIWDYVILKPNQPNQSYEGKILVPFSFESALSVQEEVLPQKTNVYRKNSSYLVNGRVKGFD